MKSIVFVTMFVSILASCGPPQKTAEQKITEDPAVECETLMPQQCREKSGCRLSMIGPTENIEPNCLTVALVGERCFDNHCADGLFCQINPEKGNTCQPSPTSCPDVEPQDPNPPLVCSAYGVPFSSVCLANMNGASGELCTDNPYWLLEQDRKKEGMQ